MKIFKGQMLLVLSLIVLIGVLSGCTEEVAEQEAEKTDVVVVGGGASGLMAAIEADEAGKDVILLEKMPALGGSTIRSQASFLAVDSSINEELEIEPSKESLVDFLVEQGDGEVNEELITRLVGISGDTVDKLLDKGVPFNTEQLSTGTPHSSEKWRVRTEGEGPGLISALQDIIDETSIDLRLESSAISLLEEDNEVVGVEVESNDEVYEIESQKVILATGGFDRNEELMEELNSDYDNNVSLTGIGNTGDGLTMAKEMGADIVGNGVIGIMAVNEDFGYMGDIGSLLYGSNFFINQDGERFADESKFYPEFHQDLNDQPNKLSYVLFGEDSYQENLDEAVEEGVAVKADTIEELADELEIDPKTLTNTIETYNEDYREGEDTEFGTSVDNMTPIKEGPYYALQVKPAKIGTIPGLRTDENTRVLDEDGEPIPNLFASGEVIMGNVIMDEYPSSGMGISTALFTGRIAGMEAAEEIE
ncbi:FAD-dependent oxidoreductase [Natranaerobius trueperi]|uniref:FAD-dependent oxidoreductase 2 FAD-binding domain-containing protein n=1 Tax=Natranaerobius trueperi TaxID=759412 RepID=A0A226C2K5_9FIRM|nr:FAD-dependent oxidoreductase [Natranaerobius trueperi]OWZ84669.1 hypothetical protein CDO51_02595 [Natranaerobius trueperi]